MIYLIANSIEFVGFLISWMTIFKNIFVLLSYFSSFLIFFLYRSVIFKPLFWLLEIPSLLFYVIIAWVAWPFLPYLFYLPSPTFIIWTLGIKEALMLVGIAPVPRLDSALKSLVVVTGFCKANYEERTDPLGLDIFLFP